MIKLKKKTYYVTLAGIPLFIFHTWSGHSGNRPRALTLVLHADVLIENSEGLHAPVAVNLSGLPDEVLPSLEVKDVEAPVINAIRKEVDKRQLEFVKSGKLVPVNFSSRHYDFKRAHWVFGKATDDSLANCWRAKCIGRPGWWAETSGWATSPGALRGTSPPDRSSKDSGDPGADKLERRYATANPPLMAQAAKFEVDMQTALEELEKKHAYERGQKIAG